MHTAHSKPGGKRKVFPYLLVFTCCPPAPAHCPLPFARAHLSGLALLSQRKSWSSTTPSAQGLRAQGMALGCLAKGGVHGAPRAFAEMLTVCSQVPAWLPGASCLVGERTHAPREKSAGSGNPKLGKLCRAPGRWGCKVGTVSPRPRKRFSPGLWGLFSASVDRSRMSGDSPCARGSSPGCALE